MNTSALPVCPPVIGASAAETVVVDLKDHEKPPSPSLKDNGALPSPWRWRCAVLVVVCLLLVAVLIYSVVAPSGGSPRYCMGSNTITDELFLEKADLDWIPENATDEERGLSHPTGEERRLSQNRHWRYLHQKNHWNHLQNFINYFGPSGVDGIRVLCSQTYPSGSYDMHVWVRQDFSDKRYRVQVLRWNQMVSHDPGYIIQLNVGTFAMLATWESRWTGTHAFVVEQSK